MRILLAGVLGAFLAFSGLALAQSQSAPAPRPKASVSDSHEGLTITVEPWIRASDYKDKFPKRSPFSAGVIALHLIFVNDSDESIKLAQESIRLLVIVGEDSRQELVPLTPDDVADAVLLKNNGKDPTAKRNPLPFPAGKPNPMRDKNWTGLRDDAQNAGIPSAVIAAHGKLDGLVYFDLRGDSELLQTARLYIPSLVSMKSRTPLSYFDIELGSSPSN